MTRLHFISALSFAVFSSAAAQGLDAEAANLLARARDNQVAFDRAFDVVFVRDSYLRGEDSLRGWMDFRDARGERRLSLAGGGESFEWWSRRYGGEQWRRDAATERLRRIPPHSLKKPALASSPLSYEDLLRFPLGYFDKFKSCKRLQETDSTYLLTLVLSPGASSRYTTAEVTLGKRPILLRRAVFSAATVRGVKTFDVASWRWEKGKYAPADVRIGGADGLSSLRLLFTARAEAPVQDKTWAPEPSPGARQTPQWEARERDEGAE